MQRIGGFRRKTRHKLRKNIHERGKISIKKFLQKFDQGTRVYLKADSGYQKGMYFPRYHGKAGIVTGKQGSCYYVKIKDQNKHKILLVHPIHLKRA
ncbi:50S ribosomal protein L21e [Candidatus Woesearchaeota archaeon]|nr:50S ribosomal protein L21e [Candidatus Woesearchaeota archaeon]